VLEMKHGVYGYEVGCRCSQCKASNTAKVARRRANKKVRESLQSWSSSPVTVSPVDSTKAAAVAIQDSAEEIARQDLTDVLTMLGSDPSWSGTVTEGTPGEIDCMTVLIDWHNRAGNSPLIQYWYDSGRFWVGAADDAPDVPASDQAEMAEAVDTVRTGQPALQLPKWAPLALPRNARPGRTPVVAKTSVRSPDATSQRGNRDGVPDEPTWG
jgi:hypothetical protein